MLQPTKTFARDERDAYFDRVAKPCDEPDCDYCVMRNAVRKALGSLVEAVALVNTAADAAAVVFAECTDATCAYERDMVLSITTAGAVAEAAFDRLMVPVEAWKALPVDWAGREKGFLAIEHRRRDAIADAAEDRHAHKVAAAVRAQWSGDGRIS